MARFETTRLQKVAQHGPGAHPIYNMRCLSNLATIPTFSLNQTPRTGVSALLFRPLLESDPVDLEGKFAGLADSEKEGDFSNGAQVQGRATETA